MQGTGHIKPKACATLPTILDLAAAGAMDLAQASDMVTDAMSALGMTALKKIRDTSEQMDEGDEPLDE